jgi:hypothetical protein
MTIKVIGAGVGRTGTTSLCAGLEILLDGRCYHMQEVFQRADDVLAWQSAALGQMPHWPDVLSEYVAAVDWPASAYWQELAAAYPDALVVLSTRSDAETWFESASNTIIPTTMKAPESPWRRMALDMWKFRFTADVENKDAAIAAYDAHNAAVRATAPKSRFLDWQADQGWAPLCEALGVAVPEVPFPHKNTTADFHAHMDSGAA